ncbi:TPA: helix-turn-helix domain-containing protein [Klebsiella pneumoniae]|nr:helix-turn-helix domain-containing protein [Klebsiella pneumoniae]
MEIETFIAAGEAAFGPRWQTEMASALGYSDRTLRKWLTGENPLPSLIAADVVRVLEERKNKIMEAIEISKDKFLMNPPTGSVDTEENWLAEMPTWDEDPAECRRQFDTLIEVVKDADGNWIEAE